MLIENKFNLTFKQKTPRIYSLPKANTLFDEAAKEFLRTDTRLK